MTPLTSLPTGRFPVRSIAANDCKSRYFDIALSAPGVSLDAGG